MPQVLFNSLDRIQGVEIIVHTMHDVFSEENTEAVLLIDAENVFNSINWKVLLHNMKPLCPLISTYMSNCYAAPARLGRDEILSQKGTTQDDPTSMGPYALGILPVLHSAWFCFNKRSSN